MEIYRNLIGGEWVASRAGRRAPNINPADAGDVLGEVPLSGAAEAAAAVEAAARAHPSWGRTPPPARAEVVARAARLLAERAEEIARALVREQGKLPGEARDEVHLAAESAARYAAHGGRLGGETQPLESQGRFGYTLRRPLGVAALITSWDLPVARPAAEIAAALVAGNTVVLKPSTLTPGTAALVVRCFVDAGLPPGALNVVYGRGGELGAALLGHPAVRAVSFAGSPASGREVCRQAAAHGIRARCAPGGMNPAVVLEDADLDLAVAGVAAGAFGSAGQRRAATRRVILLHPVADAFLEKLVGVASRMRLGAGADAGADMGPLAGEEQLRAVLAHIAAARAEGAELLYGGTRATQGALARGFFLQPTLFDRCRPEMRICREVAFGPVLAVTRVESFEEALAAANTTPGAPAASLYTRDAARMFRFIDEIEAATAHVNAPTLDAEALSVGDTALDFYTETRAVSINYSR